MTIKFNVPGKKRRELVNAISAWLEEDLEYAGAPTFAYRIGGAYTVDRDGNLIPDETANEDTTERLLAIHAVQSDIYTQQKGLRA